MKSPSYEEAKREIFEDLGIVETEPKKYFSYGQSVPKEVVNYLIWQQEIINTSRKGMEE